ncbi:pre-rRNA processing protein [Yamadazyma tenuis]|uniref:WD40 repeat-like protein n=1 Tax=Candida tenuis (strain ATCC 10573 / BCRC 21748 / CBS 615 / JCM 9827 / NBRC 10315 / NRRL Y-1498 / VKM Y-70) TaxID=590646 RepID=G3B2W5_CANTC|nr:uncharacterized protein CANTEDRAFT_120764 [Yamadazyma tenuis ATCC 10573]XP_006685583.1 WD40 repeat-like protein [Yamadazyma tenuis ATCC 10573]EGV64776.1 hypothetical protein CANTEDRAFT_120764 [Yamadazyma tenuis ATCC 10573]EGV64777.1 WD40 repeat-like protein [Yamadazyma tenuis ATCC 10573]WEJ97570.1 pre-rRNA processing protein [Yamadazyma tenuis]
MAGDPFLSDPSRKRKRANRQTSTVNRNTKNGGRSTERMSRVPQDDEISGSSDTDDNSNNISDRDVEQMSSDEEFQDENAADKRRRLAKQYLENLKNADLDEDDEFNAKDLDDDIVGRRLQRDVAESKGHMFKFYGAKFSSQMEEVRPVVTRIGSKNLTGIAIHHPYLYTVSKDIELVKWQIHADKRKPSRVKHTKGGSKYSDLRDEQHRNHHHAAINCVATSPDGRFVVTGGDDGRLIIWSTENLACLKVLETRAAVNSLSFRRNSDQLYAACADLKVRTYSVTQFSQLETLYGHQDNIADISSLSRETCVSVGSRDRTALFWKIADESRLTFRSGDGAKPAKGSDTFRSEGSLDCVSMVDESHFLTGSDNGNLCLWSLAKKKPVFTRRLAHGLEPEMAPARASAETAAGVEIQVPIRQPYWITSVYAIPFSDVFVTGSYSGDIKVWKIDREGMRSFEVIGSLAAKGCVNRIAVAEFTSAKKIVVYALVGKEHRFGRWQKVEGRNALVSFAFNI